MGGFRYLLLAALAAVSGLSAACDSDTPKAPESAPETVEEFFDALNYGLQQDGKVFHTTVEIRFRENGIESLWGTTEGWIDEAATRARAHWQKGPGNTADLAERTIHLHTPDGVYSANPDSGNDPSFRLLGDAELCLPGAPSEVLALIACGFLESSGPVMELTVERSTFEGKATVALVGTYAVSSPLGSEEFPHGGPTPHPALTTATQNEFRLHLDATTYLPVAATSFLDSDPDGKVFSSVMRFQNEFVSRSALSKDWFEPGSIGYIPPSEEERRKLENPNLQTPVYWLGRSFDPGGGLPRLGELYVNSYGPRPSQGDEPNIQLGLAYRGGGGGVRLDIYPPGDWEAFTARLGGNFPWTWCSESREFALPNATVTIRSAHESFPYKEDPGQVVVVRPGETPPTPAPPTIPPLKTDPCPTTPHDRFLAEVRFKDATVVINGTLSYGGQNGSHLGDFDTPEAMEAVARGIKLRNPGE